MSKANEIQYGGNHYKQFKGHEPWDVITAWGLGYLDGTALKYIARWKHKNGLEDLRKAVHFLQKAIEVEESKKEVKKTGVERWPDDDEYKKSEIGTDTEVVANQKASGYGYYQLVPEGSAGIQDGIEVIYHNGAWIPKQMYLGK